VRDSLKQHIDEVWKRRWLVLAIAAIAVAASTLSALREPVTYTARSVLILSSSGRSPDQDAVMAAGFAQILNDQATITRLETKAGIPPGVTFATRTAASSPILIIEATAEDPAVAQDSAVNMAQAFRTDVNAVRQSGTADAIAALTRQLDEARTQTGPDGAISPQVGVLQERINAMRFDSTNQLQDLQPRAGVSESAPSIRNSIAYGMFGGTILGVLAALCVAAVSTRLNDSADVRSKTSVEPLAEIPNAARAKYGAVRSERIRALANLIGLEQLPKSTVVALTGVGRTHAPWELAAELADVWSKQRLRTVLVDTVGVPSLDGAVVSPGGEAARQSWVPALAQDGPADYLTVMSSEFDEDLPLRAARERIDALLDGLRAEADIIVLAAPAVSTAALDSQLLCTAADLTVLVVEKGAVQASDVDAARDALAKAHAAVLGAVLVEKTAEKRDRKPKVWKVPKGWNRK
jgi:polysaccharide biosynthesis transport protein